MRTPSIRRAAVALAAAFALGACGSATTARPAGAPARIRVPAGGAAAASASQGSQDKRSSEMAAGGEGGSILPYGPVELVVEGTLPTLDGEAAAWHYPAKVGVDAADVAKLARTLGIEGDVRAAPVEEGGGWRVGSTDYTGPSLTVQADALASWFYDGAAHAGGPVCGYAAEGVPGAKPAPDEPAEDDAVAPSPTTVLCAAPTPPANVPPADEARAKAMALAGALGASPAAADVRVDGDDWGRYVSWSTRLGGLVSPVGWSAAYGAEGALTSASGALGTAEEAAPYPRTGTAAALEALKAGGFGWGGPMPMPAVGSDAAATVGGGAAAGTTAPPPTTLPGSDAPSPGAPGCPPGPADEPTCPSVDTTPLPPRVVTVTGVEPALIMLFGVDGDVWLVPAYRFTGPEGEIGTVPAIDASYIEEVPPTVGVAEAEPGVAPPAVPQPAPVTTQP